jgi:hypothetical protein
MKPVIEAVKETAEAKLKEFKTKNLLNQGKVVLVQRQTQWKF